MYLPLKKSNFFLSEKLGLPAFRIEEVRGKFKNFIYLFIYFYFFF